MFVIDLAVNRARPENMQEIQLAIDKMRRKLNKEPDADSGDMGFHMALTKSTGNNVLTQLNYAVHVIWGDLREEVLKKKTVLATSLKQHEKIFEALKNRDAEGARKAMEEHISNVEKVFIGYIRENEAGK